MSLTINLPKGEEFETMFMSLGLTHRDANSFGAFRGPYKFKERLSSAILTITLIATCGFSGHGVGIISLMHNFGVNK